MEQDSVHISYIAFKKPAYSRQEEGTAIIQRR